MIDYKKFPEIKPGKKLLKRLYISVMLFVVGRAIAAAAKVDGEVKKEFEQLRSDFVLGMGIIPNGPYMVVGKDAKGRVKYMGGDPKGKKLTLKMGIRSVESAILVFTFQESTAAAFAHNRFVVDGDLVEGMAIMRILDLVEVYLLPKLVASLAVKRYPKWSEMSPVRKHVNRVLVYARTILGV